MSVFGGDPPSATGAICGQEEEKKRKKTEKNAS